MRLISRSTNNYFKDLFTRASIFLDKFRRFSIKREYSFSNDFVSYKAEKLKKYLSEFIGKQEICYLEIGVHEGRSLIWMLENILTDPTSSIVGIDNFKDNVSLTLKNNIKLSGQAARVKLIEKSSQSVLLTKFDYLFDIIYVDGSHFAKDVYFDAAYVFNLVKIGGIIIFDDYLLHKNEYSVEFRPQIAIDAFLTCFGEELQLIEHDYNIVVKKIKSIGAPRSRLGFQHAYFWNEKSLVRWPNNEPINLESEETILLEDYFKARQIGEMWCLPVKAFNNNLKWNVLAKKIGVQFVIK
ncbi:MAG: class I SAM-dependent methyltransferase [Pseudobdellovibrio sp.]